MPKKTMLIYLLISFVTGIVVSTQAGVNTQLGKGLGDNALLATLYSFVTGALLLLILAFLKTDVSALWQHLPQQSWWKLIGGILGAFMVFTTIILVPKLGIVNMLLFIILGQLISAIIIDHFGLIGLAVHPVSLYKIIGIIIVIAGIAIFFLGDKFLSFNLSR